MRSATKALQLAFQASREFASKAPKDRKVAVLGAAGGIGQPLSLLMKVNREPEIALTRPDACSPHALGLRLRAPLLCSVHTHPLRPRRPPAAPGRAGLPHQHDLVHTHQQHPIHYYPCLPRR